MNLFPILHGKKKIASPITKEHPYYCEIQTSMQNIIVGLQEDTPMHDLMLKSELLRLFYFLLQYENEERPTGEKMIPIEIYTVLKYIAEHYTEKIPIQELSKMTFLSHSRFLVSRHSMLCQRDSVYLKVVRSLGADRKSVV